MPGSRATYVRLDTEEGVEIHDYMPTTRTPDLQRFNVPGRGGCGRCPEPDLEAARGCGQFWRGLRHVGNRALQEVLAALGLKFTRVDPSTQ